MLSLFASGAQLAGRYRIERTIGEGGMAVVVAALDEVTGARVALKLLRPHVACSATARERFEREAATVRALQSVHVAHIIDFGVSALSGQEVPYIAMELLDGSDLASVIAREGALPLGAAVRYVLQACEAVAEAHAKGVVHRDLKPANLFVTTSYDGAPCVKVLDFGVSKLGDCASSMRMTATGSVVGTPLYMAPEQFLSPRNVDHRADVWALGVCLFELLTGELPFREESLAAQYAALLAQDAPAPSSRRRAIPAAVDAIVQRCLARHPASRYGSVAELARDLAAVLDDDDGELAREASRVERWSHPVVSLLPLEVPLALAETQASQGTTTVRTKGREHGSRRSGVVALASLAFAFVATLSALRSASPTETVAQYMSPAVTATAPRAAVFVSASAEEVTYSAAPRAQRPTRGPAPVVHDAAPTPPAEGAFTALLAVRDEPSVIARLDAAPKPETPDYLRFRK